jgi:hypothetical protein
MDASGHTGANLNLLQHISRARPAKPPLAHGMLLK